LNLKYNYNNKKIFLNFLPNIFIMFNIPYKDPKKSHWIRSNGIMKMDMFSAEKKIPYGRYARLILFYIVTQAIKKKSPHIYFGKSFNDFVKRINLNSTGGKQITLIQEQLNRIFSTKFSLQKWEDNKYNTVDFYIFNNNFIDFNKSNNIYLSDVFFEKIVKYSVPVNFSIIQEYKNCPMFLDLYLFLLWRTYNLKSKTVFKLKNLNFQLGAQYKNSSEFLRNCSKYIRIIKKICPNMNIEIFKEKIVLSPFLSRVNSVGRVTDL
jgi:hypothetical protein